MYEPESDAASWGLFNLDQIFNNNYYGDHTQHDVKICRERYASDNHCDTEHDNIDTDESIAQAFLQEELSLLSIDEATELSCSGKNYLQDSNVVPNWHSPSRQDCLRETDDVGSLCSSPGDRSCDGEDYSYTLKITDESELDGEVEKRLYQMVPVPFRALSDQFYRTPEHHKFVRQQVVHQLRAHPEMYEGYVPMEYGEYLKRMSKCGEWGDHVTLQAAADSYGVKILVLTSFKNTCYIEILPKDQKSKRVIYLSFWAEVHYNSIYPRDLPPSDFKKKKKWWNFRNKH